MSIELQLTSDGGIKMLQSDEVDLYPFGELEVKRASNVEFNNKSGNGIVAQAWFVESAATGEILKDGFLTRAEALAWEKAWYSPSGQGWKEFA